MQMKCALCKEERELKNSHVIPEFIYRPLYDHVHRFHILSSEGTSHRYGQKGLREKLLCEVCELRFSRHEKYASEVFTGKIKVDSERNGNLVRISGINYESFKLFGLSVLWRAGVSSLRMFSHVKLGAHEESIRVQLLSDNPGPSHKYGFILAPLVSMERSQKDLILQPTRSRLGGHLCYRFVFGGLIWAFVVSKHPPPLAFQQAFINEDGHMLMLVSEMNDVEFIMNTMKDIMGVQNENG